MSLFGEAEREYTEEYEVEGVPRCLHFFGECVMSKMKVYDCNNCWRMAEANANIRKEIEAEKDESEMSL